MPISEYDKGAAFRAHVEGSGQIARDGHAGRAGHQHRSEDRPTGTYDAQDRLTQYGTTTYTYGSNGEPKTKVEQGVRTTSYVYDALGNLTAVTLPDGTALAYLIDGQNRRIGKKVNGTLVQGFLYQGQLSPVAELDGSNQVVSRFVYGTRANVPDYLIKGGITYRIIADHLGSVRLLVNAADGTVAQRIDYDEFGRVMQNTAPGFQPLGFPGGLLDDHTGFVRFGARDYDPTPGRWTSKDQAVFGGGDFGVFTYVEGDPLNLVDYSGLRADDPQGEACRSIARKLQRIAEQIRQKELDLKYDPFGLPEQCYGDDQYPSRIKRGHRNELEKLRKKQDALLDRYLDQCGGGAPQPRLAPSPVPSPSLLLTPAAVRNVELAGKVGVVGTVLIYTWYVLAGALAL